jgi:hypothetical protein
MTEAARIPAPPPTAVPLMLVFDPTQPGGFVWQPTGGGGVQPGTDKNPQPTGTTIFLSTHITGDAGDRINIRGDGMIQFGDGTGAIFEQMFIDSVGVLHVTNQFSAGGLISTEDPNPSEGGNNGVGIGATNVSGSGGGTNLVGTTVDGPASLQVNAWFRVNISGIGAGWVPFFR